jgi:type IV secretion system protein VirB9
MNVRASGVCLGVMLINALSISAAFAESTLSEPPPDPRIRTVLFVPDQVTRLKGWVGFHIDLEFEPGEIFRTLGGGDLAGLTYDSYENHLVLKPKAPTVRTNLTVLTSRRTYIIDYVVMAGRPDPLSGELVYSLRFHYPLNTTSTPAEVVKNDLAADPMARFQNRNYAYCGSPALQPVAAGDDGVHTRLRFAPSAEIPAIFVKTDDGTESLLNFSVDGPDIVVHRLARHFILRRRAQVGCVTNQGFIGAGERLDSGTVSPHVHRHTREIAP